MPVTEICVRCYSARNFPVPLQETETSPLPLLWLAFRTQL